MDNNSITKTVLVTVALCLVCSVLVSTTAVVLRPIQEDNKRAEINRSILQVAGLQRPGADSAELLKMVETRVLDLATGEFAEAPAAGDFDMQEAARDPVLSTALSQADDVAGIGRLPRFAKVHLVRRDGRLDKIVLPVYGYGLWSTLYGFIALEADGSTVYGLQFYDHGETPGLGGRVDEAAWQALWRGKQVYGGSAAPLLEVIKGRVSAGDDKAEYKVDGLAGATLTSRGVSNMIHFWFGQRGYRKFLDKHRSATTG